MKTLLVTCSWLICFSLTIFAQSQSPAVVTKDTEGQQTLFLTNGDRLTGNVINVVDEQWIFQTNYAGIVKVNISDAEIEDIDGLLISPDAYRSPKQATKANEETATWTDKKYLVRILNFPDEWSGQVAIGVLNLSGLTEKESIAWSSLLKIPYRSTVFDWMSYYRYAETNRKKDMDNYGTSLRSRSRLTEDTFLQSDSGYSANPIKGIAQKIHQTVGYGYAVFKSNTFVLNLVPGIGVQHVKQPGTNDGTNFAYNFNEDLTWKITNTVNFENGINISTPAGSPESYIYTIKNTLNTKFSQDYLFKLSYDYDYDNKIATGLKKYNSALTTSIGYTF